MILMRVFFSPLVFLALAGCSSAQEPDKKGPQLSIGDPAPAIRANAWLNGPEHKGFEKGKVYVLDYWAIWCGPCIDMMPHLAELQAEYKEQGLVVLPITTIDGRNPRKAVEMFVKDQGSKWPFSFAVCTTEETDKAYREATETISFPASFVVDKQGKLAYFGHPMDLEEVIPKVLAGTWRGKEDAASVLAGREAMLNFLNKAGEKPLEAMKDLATFEAKYPGWANRPMFVGRKVLLLVQNRKYDEAKKLSEEFMKQLVAKKNIDELQSLRATWTDIQANTDKKYPELAISIAEAVLKLTGQDDPLGLIGLAEAYHLAGNKAKAIEYGEKSVKAASDPELKKALADRAKIYQKD
jgi:thiol-disulfide isomerase/thioredoxin